MMERKEKSHIDFKQVREGLEMTRKLKALGIKPREYSLSSPFEKRFKHR